MKTFKIEENDLVLDGQNNFIIVDGIDELAQSVERTITTAIREWFLNDEFGLNYEFFQTKQLDIERLRLELVAAISQDERVLEVNDIKIKIDRPNRKIDINFRAKTIEGELLRSEVMSLD